MVAFCQLIFNSEFKLFYGKKRTRHISVTPSMDTESKRCILVYVDISLRNIITRLKTLTSSFVYFF